MGPDDQILQFSSARPLAPASLEGEHGERIVADLSLAGSSAAVNQLRGQIRRVAPYYRTASLTGEPGCGDEAVARSLHDMGPLRERDLLIFHHEEAEDSFGNGNFPAAISAAGLLYLPDAEQLSRAAQQGLLSLLRQQGPRSTRVVAFVGRGLKPLISAGFFSAELAGALGALRIILPTLRERAADVPMFIKQQLQQHEIPPAEEALRRRPLYLSSEFLSAASRFQWPGNLPQLREAIDWLLIHKIGGILDANDLSAAIEAIAQTLGTPSAPRLVRLEQVAQEHIRSVLMACNGNKLRAAEVLGISRSTLYRMLDCASVPDSFLMTG